MKLASILCFSAVIAGSLFSAAPAEARAHFGINFNNHTTVVQERIPVYVPEVYEQVIVPARPYRQRVYVGPRPFYREVRVVPGYRYYQERARAAPQVGFSLNFWG